MPGLTPCCHKTVLAFEAACHSDPLYYPFSQSNREGANPIEEQSKDPRPLLPKIISKADKKVLSFLFFPKLKHKQDFLFARLTPSLMYLVDGLKLESSVKT